MHHSKHRFWPNPPNTSNSSKPCIIHFWRSLQRGVTAGSFSVHLHPLYCSTRRFANAPRAWKLALATVKRSDVLHKMPLKCSDVLFHLESSNQTSSRFSFQGKTLVRTCPSRSTERVSRHAGGQVNCAACLWAMCWSCVWCEDDIKRLGYQNSDVLSLSRLSSMF